MSTYQGRRGPNVSQYLQQLNAVRPSDSSPTQGLGLGIEEDFSLFTNAEFFDFDMGESPEFNAALEYDPVQEEQTRRQNASAQKNMQSKQETILPNDFQLQDFDSFPSVLPEDPINTIPSFPPNTYPLLNQPSATPVAAISPKPASSPTTNRKVEANNIPPAAESVEETSRVAAEEDKRRRNTAASARFRVKKKQREQALEKTAREMTEKVTVLEQRVMQLETENKWLKNLLTEKQENKSTVPELSSKAEIGLTENRSTSKHTDGVGTQ